MSINDPKLLQHFAEIIKFNDEIGENRGTHKKFSRITSYLIIFGKLTQKQLKILTNYSLSNLSNALNTLVERRLIKKTRITGTHTFEYEIAISIVDANRILIIILNQNLVIGENLLSEIKKELNNMTHLGLLGYEIFTNQVNHLMEDFKNYQKILGIITKFLNENSADNQHELDTDTTFQLKLENFDSYQEINFDEKLLIIEKRIAVYLHETLFKNSQTKSLDLAILVCFCTRGVLTQQKIKELTNLSVGAISQGLKVLEKRKLIEVSPQERNKHGKKKKLIYRFKSLSLAGIKRIHTLFGTIIKWKSPFEELKANLKKKAADLKDLKGYAEIMAFVENIINIIPKYERANNLVENVYGIDFLNN